MTCSCQEGTGGMHEGSADRIVRIDVDGAVYTAPRSFDYVTMSFFAALLLVITSSTMPYSFACRPDM